MTRFGILLGVVLCGCAPIPLRNRLSPYPAQGQDYNRQLLDDQACTGFAYQQAATIPQGQGAAVGAVGGAAVGAASGAIAGAFWGAAGSGAAAGAALGGLLGVVNGSAADAQLQDQTALLAYRNCMAARGYVVP